MSGALPPRARSIAGSALQAITVDGTLQLQRCADCGAVQYPPRERCGECLADALQVVALAGGATLLSTTSLHHSLEPWFAGRLPWTVASVRLDAGPVAFAHLAAPGTPAGARVRVATAHDPSGAWCLVAFADDGSEPATALAHALHTLGMDT